MDLKLGHAFQLRDRQAGLVDDLLDTLDPELRQVHGRVRVLDLSEDRLFDDNFVRTVVEA
ncbi:hypothetical protein DCC24_11280 [Auritidibacter sp. NML100628]|uniref:hypothetical protein n=1 Tax=Auritidibacter ignavus TaxID=678932 RepID=UPI000D732FD3|nr:hypothetical protein [Auritidibacter ignavus]PXA75370.1 hypothetical protein DCC24_11280 [Auritidibacter sp. NML100628]